MYATNPWRTRQRCPCVREERPISPCADCWHFGGALQCVHCGQPPPPHSSEVPDEVSVDLVESTPAPGATGAAAVRGGSPMILDRLRDDAEAALHRIREKAEADQEAVGAALERDMDAVCAANGKTRCPRCKGIGAVLRLDAGYMRRFGLREWNGCEQCGGDRDRKGRGYLDSPSDPGAGQDATTGT